MADNVGYTPGVGATVAADDVGGVLYQVVKLDVGGNGVSSALSTSNRLPVSLPASGSDGVDRSITATATSSQLMAANPSRTRFFIKNDTATDVWINMGATAVATAGSGNMKILANGGYFEFQGGTSAINIIATSGTAAVTAREF